jgi:hypothetical protein
MPMISSGTTRILTQSAVAMVLWSWYLHRSAPLDRSSGARFIQEVVEGLRCGAAKSSFYDLQPAKRGCLVTVWLMDRFGNETECDSLDIVSDLLTELHPVDDEEYGSISIGNDDAWHLEFYRDSVVFCNAEPGGRMVGRIRGSSSRERLDMVAEFIAGDFPALYNRDWFPYDGE